MLDIGAWVLGGAPLHLAAAVTDNPDVITRLVELGADPNARDGIGWTPLHLAARLNDNLDVTVRLFRLGANLNARPRCTTRPATTTTLTSSPGDSRV